MLEVLRKRGEMTNFQVSHVSVCVPCRCTLLSRVWVCLQCLRNEHCGASVSKMSFYSPVHVLRVADTVCFICEEEGYLLPTIARKITLKCFICFLVYIVTHVLFLDCVDCRLHTGCKCKNLCWPSGLNLQWCIQNVGWSWKGRDSRCLCNTRSAYVCYGRTVPSTYVACMCLEVNTTVKCCMCTFTAQ